MFANILLRWYVMNVLCNPKNIKTMDKDKKNEVHDYRGVDINIADNDKNTPSLQKEDTRTINNNPRNAEGPQPE